MTEKEYNACKSLLSDLEKATEQLKDRLKEAEGKLEKNDERDKFVATPYFRLDGHIIGGFNTETGIIYPDGTKLKSEIMSTANGTYTFFTDTVRKGIAFPLTAIEIKKGDIAEAYNLPEDNNNIDVRIWGNPYEEDYTHAITINGDDIEKIATEELETEK